jgi:lipopolysaccharide heptosyltransferase II
MLSKEGIHRILVSRLRFMGDVILTTPLLHALRTSFPRAHITYMAENPYQTMLENHPAVDFTLGVDIRDRSEYMRLIYKLIRSHYDLAIDLFGNPRSAFLTQLSGAAFRIGGDFRGRRRFYTHKIRDDGKPKSAVAFHLGYLAPLGIPAPVTDPYLVVTEEEKSWAGEFLRQKGYDIRRPIVGIHPGASWPAKIWLASRFAALANRLVSELGAQIYININPGDEETGQHMVRNCLFPVPELEILTLRELAAVLSLCTLFISNDCGPMHMAPAVGTRTIGIFGPGEPEIWFPYNQSKGHHFIHHEIDCCRCHQDFCDKLICMRSIQVDEVFDAVSELWRSE